VTLNKESLANEADQLNEKSLTAEWRAVVSLCREHGVEVDRMIQLAINLADVLRIPDDTPLIPAIEQASRLGRQAVTEH
jgi:hypothetical protein